MAPDDSPVAPSRGQIGARLVNRYVGGDQRTAVLWTAERMFPCGAIVEDINDGATDTCSTFDALGIDRPCCL